VARFVEADGNEKENKHGIKLNLTFGSAVLKIIIFTKGLELNDITAYRNTLQMEF
jgi:hypothetical protein